MVITRLLPSHYQPFSFTASDARGSQASLSAPNNGSRWRRLAAPGASIYSRSWKGRETSPWGERREHCRRPHLLPLLGRQGNSVVGREGNTAAASIYSRSWEDRETSPWGEKGTLPPPAIHILLLGRQGNVAVGGEGNTAAASIYSRSWEGRETSPWGEKKAGARRCRAPAFFSHESAAGAMRNDGFSEIY